MHDLDRTQLENEGSDEFEEETDGFLNELIDEINAELGAGLEGESDETEETELASELLEVADEAEFEEFLGKVISSAWRRAKGLAKGPLGTQVKNQLLQGLKSAAGDIAPALANATPSGFDSQGKNFGEALGTSAEDAFGLELEGLSPEDREFEAAKQFVHFVKCASKSAAGKTSDLKRDVPAQSIAKAAIAKSVQKNAPGLARSIGTVGGRQTRGCGSRPRNRKPGSSSGATQTGLWERQGNTIVLHI